MLTERQSQILKKIIDEYIKSAQPVGSKALCEDLNCSSATIRNEMATLENTGYLEKTHTSSGRIPSEKGYRFYVDNLMQPKSMTGEDMLKLQTIFRNNTLQINDAVKESMKIISELTNYTSIVLGSTAEENKLKQVKLVPLSEKKAVALVITDKGHVENRNIMIPDDVSLEEVEKTVELINDLLEGTPLNQVSSKLEFEIKPIIGKYVNQHHALYRAFQNAFNQFKKNNNVFFSGKTNLLLQPEFSEADKMRNLINLIESEDIPHHFTQIDNEITIKIGSENDWGDDYTVITTKYKTGQDEGTIAILGPKRMEYNKVVSLLEIIKDNIDDTEN